MPKKYQEKILELSMLLNKAQKPIQILDAIKWNEETEKFLIRTKFKEIPKIDEDYYSQRALKYDPDQKIFEFKNIINKIELELSKDDPVRYILIRNCEQYINVVHMIKNRGNKKFFEYSKKLYGSPNDYLSDNKTKLSDLTSVLTKILSGLKESSLTKEQEKVLTSEDVVSELTKRLRNFFEKEAINIKISDGIVSDASAGSDYIKIKSNTMFSKRDVHVFEVHEGWVHLGTTLNGDSQPYAKWLSKGPPCSTVTQEGLAIFTELINFALYPKRANRLNDRMIVCKMVEDGANLLEVVEYFRLQGLTEEECIKNAGRAFRGSTATGGAPFTKDISYLKGFVEVYEFIRHEIKNGRPEVIPFLFAGKATLEDVPVLYNLHLEGLVEYPKYMPPQIKDLNGLSVWMAFSNFFDLVRIEEEKKLLKIA